MSGLELMARRESCRRYDTSREVETEKLTACARAAQIAPSACNSQPWSFLAVKNPVLCKQIAPLLQEDGFNRFAGECPAFVLVREEPALLINGKTGGKTQNQHFASIDIGLAVMQFCLEAAEQELGTCIMGSFNEQKLNALLGLTDEKPIRVVLAVGYPTDGRIREKKRKELSEIFSLME